MTAVSATTARANLYRLIDQVNEESEPLTITGQRRNAVLIGEEDWRAIQETLFLVSVPVLAGSMADISNTKTQKTERSDIKEE